MNTLLRIYISEHWPQQPKAAWALVAADGSLLQEGISEPQHWPAAGECEAIMSAPQAVWLRARLPAKVPRAELPRLLANALEDQVMDEPERQHFTITERDDAGASVLVAERDRLRRITAQFASLGRPLSRAYSELQTAPAAEDPPPSGAWHLSLGTDAAVLRRNLRDGAALDLEADPAEPPSMLAALVRTAQASDALVPTLVVHAPDVQGSAAATPDADAWELELGVPVRPGPPYRWYESTRDAANLLHGELLPLHRQRAWLTAVRPALWLAIVVVAADTLVGLGQVAWKRHQITQVEQRTAQMFQSTFPGVPPLDPPAQMRRQLDVLRSPLGRLRSDDALTLLYGLTDSLGPDGRDGLTAVHFEDGTLEASLAPALAANAESIRRQLALRGFSAQVNTEGAGTRLVIRGDAR